MASQRVLPVEHGAVLHALHRRDLLALDLRHLHHGGYEGHHRCVVRRCQEYTYDQMFYEFYVGRISPRSHVLGGRCVLRLHLRNTANVDRWTDTSMTHAHRQDEMSYVQITRQTRISCVLSRRHRVLISVVVFRSTVVVRCRIVDLVLPEKYATTNRNVLALFGLIFSTVLSSSTVPVGCVLPIRRAFAQCAVADKDKRLLCLNKCGASQLASLLIYSVHLLSLMFTS